MIYVILIGIVVVFLFAMPIRLSMEAHAGQKFHCQFTVGYLGLHLRKQFSFDWRNLIDKLISPDTPEPTAFSNDQSPPLIDKPAPSAKSPEPEQPPVLNQNNNEASNQDSKTDIQDILTNEKFWHDLLSVLKKILPKCILEQLEIDYTLAMKNKHLMGMISGVVWSMVNSVALLDKNHIHIQFNPDFNGDQQHLYSKSIILIPLGHIMVSCIILIAFFIKHFGAKKIPFIKRSVSYG